MSPLQVIFALIMSGIATVGAFVILGPNVQATTNNSMINEVTNVTKSINRMCSMATGGCAAVTSFEALTDRGYLDSEFYTDGVGENVRQGSITAVTVSATAVTMTYDAGTQPQCLYLVDHDEQYVGVEAVPTCSAAGLLTLSVR